MLQKQQSQTVPQPGPSRRPFPPMPTPQKRAERLPLPPSAARKPKRSSSASTAALPLTPPLVHTGRPCKTAGCNGKIEPDTVMTRCFRCVLEDWKHWGRKRGENQQQRQGQEERARKKRKVVSWADEVQVDGGRAASCSSLAGSSSITEDQSAQSDSTSTQASSTAAEAVCRLASSPKSQLESLELAGPKLTLKGPQRNPWSSTHGHLSTDRDKQVESVSPSFPSDASVCSLNSARSLCRNTTAFRPLSRISRVASFAF